MPVSARRLQSARDAVAVLQELLSDDDPDPARLLSGYLDAKRQLATTFREIAEDFYADQGPWAQLLNRAAEFPDGRLPGATRPVRALGSTHKLIFAYLWHQAERGADTDALRLLTGDAVHTERRVRELREAGLRVVVAGRAGLSVYVLDQQYMPWVNRGACHISSSSSATSSSPRDR